MQQQLITELEATGAKLIEELSKIEDELWNAIPFEGSWTPGQLAQHLILSNGGFAELIHGPVKTTERPVDVMVEELKTAFLDFSIKMQSPEFVLPPTRHYNKGEQISTLQKIHKALLEAANNTDLTQTCLAFELPSIGYITRLEALYFVLYHTQRHTQQLIKIGDELKSGKLDYANK